jgi:hypothetical protein
MGSRELLIEEALTGERELTPDELAVLVDYFKVVEKSRLDADKVAAEIKSLETKIKQVLILTMHRMNLTAAGGQSFICECRTVEEPTVSNWDDFYKYVLKTKDFSLLERRPGKAAIKERWNDGKSVPGITKFPVDKLYFSKTKGA